MYYVGRWFGGLCFFFVLGGSERLDVYEVGIFFLSIIFLRV